MDRSFPMPETLKMFIGGEWVDAMGGETQSVINPANRQVIATIPKGGTEDAKRAIDAALEAEGRSERFTAYERYRVLMRVAQLLEERKEEMARLIALNVGKPLSDAEVEVTRASLVFTFAAEEAKRIYGETIPLDAYPIPPGNENRLGLTFREPIGVVAAITPFNFPLNLLAHKVAPAIAAGDPVIAKPPSDGPLPALKLAEYFVDAGLPAGMYNVVTGPGSSVGNELITNPKVSAVSFTGDTSTGRYIAQKAAETNKRVILELGGHDPMVVLDDADLQRAAKAATLGVFTYSGQVCTATKRILVHEKVKTPFLESFTKEVKALKVGDPLDKSTRVGPVINEKALQKIASLVEDAKERGAKLLLGGRRLEEEPLDKGFFFAPTVLDDVQPNMRVAQEEIFGPVAPIIPVEDDEEASEVANGTIYGLQACIYTNDLRRGIKLAKRIKAGSVLINDRTNLRWDNAPFGGVKGSGLGREGVRYAIQELTEIKFVVINLS